MTLDVLDANEVLLGDGTTTARFPVLGGVQVSLISIFPGKVTIGEYTRDTEQLASSYIMENFQGGLLIEQMDVQRHQDRLYFATLDSRFERSLLLLPQAQEAPVDDAPGRVLRAGADYGGRFYAAFDERIRQWADGSSRFVAPPGVAALLSAATDAITVKLPNGTALVDWLVFCSGDSYVKYDGTTWTQRVGDGTSYPQAKWLAVWDHRLWCLDVRNRLWVTQNLAAANDGWAPKAVIPALDDEAQWLGVFFDQAGEPALHATTRDGLWVYDAVTDHWLRTRVYWPRHPLGGRGAAIYRGDLFLPAGASIYRFTGSVVTPVGLDRDYGLPQPWRGDIVRLADGFNWLLAGLRAPGVGGTLRLYGGEDTWMAPAFTTPSGPPAAFAWDGTGWHLLWTGEAGSTGLHWLGVSAADGQVRLWVGTDQRTYYLPLPRGLHHPREMPSWQFAPSGYAITPWFDAGWAELTKLAVSLKLRGERLTSTGNQIRLEYEVDRDGVWRLLGTLQGQSPQPGTVYAEWSFGPSGVPFRTIRFRITLARGADATLGPIFDFAALKYLRLLDPLYGYTFTVDLGQPYGGRTPEELLAWLRGAAASQRLLTLRFRRAGQELVTRPVRLTRLAAAAFTGEDTRGRVQVAVVEV